MSSSSSRNTVADGSSDEYTMTLYKTEMCRSFSENGYCRYGVKCRFAHGHVDLRPVARHKKYKTELCNNFIRTGVCPYASRCRFIHESSPAQVHTLTSPSNRSNSSSPSRSPSSLVSGAGSGVGGGGGQYETFQTRSSRQHSTHRAAHSQSAHLQPQSLTSHNSIGDSPLLLSSSVPNSGDAFSTATLLNALSHLTQLPATSDQDVSEYQSAQQSPFTSLSYSAFDNRLFPVRSVSDGFDPNRRAHAETDAERFRHAHFAQERHAQANQRLFDPIDTRQGNMTGRIQSAHAAEPTSIMSAYSTLDDPQYAIDFRQRNEHSRAADTTQRHTVHDITTNADFDDEALHTYNAQTYLFATANRDRTGTVSDRLSPAEDDRVDFSLDVESLAIHSAEQTALIASHAFLTPSPSPALEESEEERRIVEADSSRTQGAMDMGSTSAMNIPFHHLPKTATSALALDDVFVGRTPKSPFFHSNSPFATQSARVGTDILSALSQHNVSRSNTRSTVDRHDTDENVQPGELDLNDSFPPIQLEPFTARTTETSPSLSSLSSYSSHSSPSLSSSLSSVTSTMSAYHFTHHSALLQHQHTQSVSQQQHCRKNT